VILVLISLMALVIAVSLICYPKLVSSLRQNDQGTWLILGSPPEYAFSKTLGVYNWLLGQGYNESGNEEVRLLGALAYKKALVSKYLFITAIISIIAGFILTLIQTQ